jgi:hypothetical protein
LKAWVHPSKQRIYRLTDYPLQQGRGKWIVSAVGRNETSVWDIETSECKGIFTARNLDEKSVRPALIAVRQCVVCCVVCFDFRCS